MNSQFLHFLSMLKNPFSPVYYALFLILLLTHIIWLIHRKKRLEYDNLRIMAAFSDSDPNPVVRTDLQGNIIHFNNSASVLFRLSDGQNINFTLVAPGLNFDFHKEINNGSDIQHDWSLGDKFFKVHFYGIKTLSMARIYFVDQTEHNKYRSLSFYLQDHLETEKQRIGLELHDSIGQNLNSIKLKLNDPALGYQKHDAAFNEINNTVTSAIEDLREIIFNLRPRALTDSGLISAVRMMVDNFAKTSGTIGSFEYVGTPVKLTDKVELNLFRIIQESLSNILKHSKASEYHIQFVYSAGYLKILIADNVIGFDTGNIINLKHYGLLNIHERIKTLKGKMKITSSDLEGTSLLIDLPYELS